MCFCPVDDTRVSSSYVMRRNRDLNGMKIVLGGEAINVIKCSGRSSLYTCVMS